VAVREGAAIERRRALALPRRSMARLAGLVVQATAGVRGVGAGRQRGPGSVGLLRSRRPRGQGGRAGEHQPSANHHAAQATTAVRSLTSVVPHRPTIVHLESWWADLRVAARHAARRPGFTLLVALTLALGLGVNSAVFALVDAVLLRPLPFRDPSRLVYVWQTLPDQNVFEVEASAFDYTAWQSLRSLTAIAMINYGSFTLTGGSDEPERVRGVRVTSSLMPMLGIAPAIGRGFAAAEDRDAASAA